MVVLPALVLCHVQHVLGIGDDSMNLLQASINKVQTQDDESQAAAWTASKDLTVRPGTDNYSIVLSGLPNPDLIHNNGRDCQHMWGKRYNQVSSPVECGSDCQSGSDIEDAVYSPFIEACCPGECSKSATMNPVKYIVENKLEDEVRCLSRYGNSISGSGWNSIPGRLGGEVSYTCDMLVKGAQGWRTYRGNTYLESTQFEET